MPTTSCICGRSSISYPEGVEVKQISCGACDEDRVGGVILWRPGRLHRLDAWLHESRLPEWSWRWICDLHDWRNRR